MMNIKIRFKSTLIALCLLGSPAYAATMTLDFDQFEDSDVPSSGAGAGAPAGPVAFNNANHGVYDAYLPSILLGDDGWDSSISFDANAGYIFDAVSLRFVGGWQNVYTAPVSGAVSTTSATEQLAEAMRTDTLSKLDYPNVAFTGYRSGAVVAMQEQTYSGGAPTPVSFSSAFTALDKLKIELNFGYADSLDPRIVGNMLYYCPNERCGILEFDDLVLNVLTDPGNGPTTVPLPTPLLMLGSAFFGLASLSWRGKFSRAS